MKAHLFKYTCLTNLHVGSGDANYNIVDNEVEKDPVTGYPIIHASGVKGALREHYTGKLSKEDIVKIFGAPPRNKEDISSGTYKFLDARLLARPMRVSGSCKTAYIAVTTIDAVNGYLQLLTAFGCNHYGIDCVCAEDSIFGDAMFLTNSTEPIRVEGEVTAKLPEALEKLTKLSDVLGDTFAVARSFEDYPLPVVARNQLEKSISKNLWYEEVVPHHSVFYQIILTPDDTMQLGDTIVQFGGNASIGCGFVLLTPLQDH